MDALKAGAHKVEEAVHGKKADEHLEKASDPSKAPSDRIDHAHAAAKSECKANEHACKADCKANEHKH
ncbi:unnamed protein product [Rotaria sordida]|uniref:Uncharacterized protein n=1 Tax=Rotaria sordida TaxID=392033 RepID=A0A814J6Y1_9BILA|nr:unnamed protein product [Rotaria sordida]CAF1035374.1 unnamed protein product [Rotaria sordida]CAF3668325.1 unnamed protein product [Rotaria sordida]